MKEGGRKLVSGAELMQLDGSFHAWLEERGPVLCLMNRVDAARGETLSELHEQETTWAAANQYLRQEYLPDHHRRFRWEAAEPENYHRKAPGKRELDAIFRLREERTISNDWVVRYQGCFLQIERQSAPRGHRGSIRRESVGAALPYS